MAQRNRSRSKTSNDVCRILSLDGGMGGVFTLALLRRIEAKLPGFIESTDIIAGVSAGSMNAGIFAAHEDVEDAFEAATQHWISANEASGDLLRMALAISGHFPLMGNGHWLESLRRILGTMTIGTVRKNVIIPALKLDNPQVHKSIRRWHPRIFSNLRRDEPEADDLLVDVIARSSSAPIVSPAYQGYIDGGIFANNPALLALTFAMDAYEKPPGQFIVFSVGTGRKNHYVETSYGILGYSHWFIDPHQPMALLNAVNDSNSEMVNFQCSRLLQEAYFRLNPDLDVNPVASRRRVSGHSMLEYMDSVADKIDLRSALDWLRSRGWTHAYR